VRRSLFALLVVSLAAALVLPEAALGIRVHVRVEGVRTTIFGATQPLVEPFTGALVLEDTTLEVPSPTVLGALERASARGEFFYRVTVTGFGPYVSQIGRLGPREASGWVYKVNGVSPPVGADAYVLEDGDEVLWYYATFGPAGGPLTLDLERAGQGCFRAFDVDDAGARSPARDVVFRLDDHGVEDADGLTCPRGVWHRLKATRAGAVRSQVVIR
jgi:hypothetical protein